MISIYEASEQRRHHVVWFEVTILLYEVLVVDVYTRLDDKGETTRDAHIGLQTTAHAPAILQSVRLTVGAVEADTSQQIQPEGAFGVSTGEHIAQIEHVLHLRTECFSALLVSRTHGDGT